MDLLIPMFVLAYLIAGIGFRENLVWKRRVAGC